MEALPSLPPGVRGLVQGVLVLEVQALEGVEADEVWVKFYGAQRAEQVKLQCKVIYAIRSPKEVFVGYLEDMKELRVEVVQKGRAIGRAAVDFGPYISTQAEPLQLQGKFPICQEDEIGDVVIAAYTDFETWEEELARTGLAPETSLGEAEKPFPTANFAGNLEIVRIPRSALRRIDRPAPKAENPSKSSSISQSQLIESLQKRGETLRKLMAAREKVPETVQEETSPGKSIPLLPLPTIKHLKLQVQSLTVLDSSLVQSRVLVLDCSIPSLSLQPGLKLSQAAQNRYEGTTPLSIETFHLQHKGGSGNVYVYEHESWHSVNVGNIGGLANSAVTFRMQVEREEVGRGEVRWAAVLAAPGRVYSTVVALKASGLGKGGKAGEVGLLSVRFELLVEAAEKEVLVPLRTAHFPLTQEFPLSQANVSDGVSETEPRPVPLGTAVHPVAYQLFLFLANAYQLDPRPDCTPRNLFLRYKSLFDSEFITTPVLWEWQDSLPFNHTLIVPVLPSDKVITRMSTGRLNIEVWDKYTANENELLGLVALPLGAFVETLKAGSVLGSVYPVIAVDDYRAVHSFQRDRDVGYLRVCMALGTSAQVQRLNDRYQQPKKQKAVLEAAVTVPISRAESAVQTIVAAKAVERPPIQPTPAKLTESLESIGDIAAFLNRKSTETLPPIPPKPETQPIPFSNSPQPSKALQESLDIDKTLAKLSIQLADINLEEALQASDVFSRDCLHREAFISLLESLGLGLSPKELAVVSDYILSVSEMSTFRKIRHCDILSALKIAPKRRMGIKHVFTLKLAELSSCLILGLLPSLSAYLRVQFPLDDGSYESSLLGEAANQSLSLVSTHTCTVYEGQRLEDYMAEGTSGVEVWLCKNEKRSETQVLGKALLPVEEVLELAGSSGQIARTLCLYADQNPHIGSFPADIIGKIRCCVSYSQEKTFESPGTTSEVPWGRRITHETPLSSPSLLTLSVLSASSLHRGLDYYSSQGVDLGPWLQGYVRVSLFHESEELRQRLEDVNTRVVEGRGKLSFQQRFQLEVSLEKEVLDYIRNETAFFELVLKVSGEELIFGALTIPLLPILLNGVSGEFSLLNKYGQHMGNLCLVLSLNKEDIRLGTDFPTQIPPIPSHIDEITKAPTPLLPSEDPPIPTKQANSEEIEPLVKLLLSVETGLRIGSFLFSTEAIYPYLKVIWQGRKVAHSAPAQTTTYPAWDFSHTLEVFEYEELRGKSLVIETAYRLSEEDREVTLGSTEIDLNPLLKLQDISGWYQVLHRSAPAGQLKVRISPLDLKPIFSNSSLLTQKPSRPIDQFLTTRDEDLRALHTAKMQALDQLTVTLQQKYKLAV